jgi:hypothetical protein
VEWFSLVRLSARGWLRFLFPCRSWFGFYISRLCIVTAHQAIMGVGRFGTPGFALVQQEWDQLALQAHDLIICNTLLAGPMWRKEIRGYYFPSPCLISYSTPTDFINVCFLWPSARSGFVSVLTFSTSLTRIPCSIYKLVLSACSFFLAFVLAFISVFSLLVIFLY